MIFTVNEWTWSSGSVTSLLHMIYFLAVEPFHMLLPLLRMISLLLHISIAIFLLIVLGLFYLFFRSWMRCHILQEYCSNSLRLLYGFSYMLTYTCWVVSCLIVMVSSLNKVILERRTRILLCAGGLKDPLNAWPIKVFF